MRNIFSILFATVFFISCSTDVRKNNPGFQAYRDGVLFKGTNTSATLSASTGVLTIKSLADNEEVDLRFGGSGVGSYYVGTTNTNYFASYTSSFSGSSMYYGTQAVAGPVANVEIYTGGTAYTTDYVNAGSNTWVPNSSHPTVAVLPSTGTGLTVSIQTNSNNTGSVVTAGKVASPGINYSPGDIVTVTGGGNDAKFKVFNTQTTNGIISITDNSNGTVTGTFKFNAVNPTSGSIVNFQYGNFYKIPVTAVP